MGEDDELQRLKSQVTDRLGGDQIEAAIERALDVVNQLPIDMAENAKPLPMSVFHEALKVELRRLLVVH